MMKTHSNTVNRHLSRNDFEINFVNNCFYLIFDKASIYWKPLTGNSQHAMQGVYE